MLAFCLRTTSVLSLLLFMVASADAQDPNLQLSLQGPASVSGGSSFSTSVTLDNLNAPGGDEVAGWSYGVCHDPAMLQLNSAVEGATTLTVNGGSPPDFMTSELLANGYTFGAVIDFFGIATLPPGTAGAELTVADYTVLASNPIEPDPALSTAISFCDTLGIAVVLTVNANSVTPTQNNLALTIPTEPLINPNYVLRLEAPALVQTDDTVIASVRLDNLGLDLAGWSFGVCFDPAELSLNSIDDGAATMIVRSGQPAEFITNQMHPGGATSGVVVCFNSCAFLNAGTVDAELSSLNFTALSAPDPEGPPVTTALDFCDTLGAPPIRTVVTVNGNSIIPTQISTTLDIEGVPPTNFQYSVDPIPQFYFVPSAPVDTPFEATIRVTQTGIDPPIDTQGFSMGLSHDPAQISTVAIAQSATLQSLSPTGPEFFQPAIHPNGWTVATLYSISAVQTLSFAVTGLEVLHISYSTVAAGFAGVNTFQNVPLTWADTLGSPPVLNVVAIADGTGTFPIQLDGVVPMEPQFSGGYVRGDTNGDGEILITDAVWLLADMFQGGPTTRDVCFAANDVNADGLIHLADPVYLLNFLFAAGAQPAFPFPECGITSIPDCELPGFCSP